MNLVFPLAMSLLLAVSDGESDEQRAKNLVRAAQRSYRDGKYRDAISQFEEALALKPRPGLHYNLARCYEALAELAPAMKEYREYLRLAPEATDRAVVQETVLALENKLAAKGDRQLLVTAEPMNAQLFVDDGGPQTSPLYVTVTPGKHRLRVVADGHEPVEREVLVEGTRSPQVHVTLRIQRDTPRAEAPAPKPELLPAPPPPAPPLVVTEPAPPRRRVFTWIAGGTAVVAAGVATGFGVSANNSSRELLRTIHPRAEGDALVAQTRDAATAANVAWAAAGTALVTAIVLFFVEAP